MSEIIPSITITQFKKLKVEELKLLKCCEVTENGEYLFSYINPQTDFVKLRAEYLGQLSNSVGGKTIDEILHKEPE